MVRAVAEKAYAEKAYTLPMDPQGRAERSGHLRQSNLRARHRCAPWQWDIWFVNMLRLGAETEDFGLGLLKAAGIDPPVLDLGSDNTSKRTHAGTRSRVTRTGMQALAEMAKSLKTLE